LKPFSGADENVLEQRRRTLPVNQSKGQGDDRGCHGTICIFQRQHFSRSRVRCVSYALTLFAAAIISP